MLDSGGVIENPGGGGRKESAGRERREFHGSRGEKRNPALCRGGRLNHAVSWLRKVRSGSSTGFIRLETPDGSCKKSAKKTPRTDDLREGRSGGGYSLLN